MGPPELLDPTPLLLLGGCCRHGLAFSPHHPVGWLQGEAQGQLMGRRSPNPSSHSNTLPGLTGGWGGQTHQQRQKSPGKKSIKESPNIFATEKHKSRLLHLP